MKYIPMNNPLRHPATGSRKRRANLHRLSPGSLADYIAKTHHTYIRKNLPAIQKCLFEIAVKEGEKFPYMKRVFILFTQVRTELDSDLSKEEGVLFPALKKLTHPDPAADTGDLRAQIKIIQEQHEVAGQLMRKIRQLTGDYAVPAGAGPAYKAAMRALREFEADFRTHVDLENNLLFAKAIAHHGDPSFLPQ
jgi:regulator of cell morphogenesis and NO signaling